MKIVAKPYPVGVHPFAAQMGGNCQYPWCTHPAFVTDSSEMVIHARVSDSGITVTGNMHVSHTPLFDRYGDRQPEFYDDGRDEYGVGVDEHGVHAYSMHARTHGEKLLDEIINTVPTRTEYVSNVEDIIKRLDVSEVLIIKRAGGSMRRTRVHVWIRRT